MSIGAVITGLSLLPEIAKGAETVFGLVEDLFDSGGTKPSTAVSNVTSGSGIASVVRQAGIRRASAQGTSVGPVIEGVATAVTALPAVVKAVQDIRRPGTAVVTGQPGAGVPPTMTRRQFILAVARANNPGATAKKILRSARECGIELAAATFGLDVLDVCFLIAQPPTRRSRGISAADIRRTRSTMRKINGLKDMCPPARRRRK